MSRFMQEISGALGDWWKEHAEKEVAENVKYADENAVVEDDGAIRWKSGNYVPDDYCEKLEYAGYHFSRAATAKKRDIQDKKFIEEYRKHYKGPSEEELIEMRAAFGAGTTVVDVITGKEIYR